MAGSTKLLTSSGGGVILTPASNIASDVTVNIPPVNGTLVNTGSTGQVTQTMLSTNVAGNGPSFSAYQSGAQGVTLNTATKVIFQTKDWDTASCFDNSTNYRFTPTVAGYYQINAGVGIGSTPTTVYTLIYKNGSVWTGTYLTASTVQTSTSGIVFLNGSTDYVEIYTQIGSSQNLLNQRIQTYFNAAMIRSA